MLVGRLIAGFSLALLLLAFAGAAAGVRVNRTASLPMGLYWIRPTATYRRFAIVEACLPDRIAAFGHARGYLLPGICQGGITPVLKVVVGVPGDRVKMTDTGLTVDGRHIAGCGLQLRADDEGRLLPQLRGSWLLRREVWLCGVATDSWDSRYYGPVTITALRGAAIWHWAQGRGWRRLESWKQLFAPSI